MEEEKCSECKNGLVFGEKNQCIYCELTQTTGNKSCPKCTKSVLRDKGSLYCELCKCFYHNACNEFPLDDQYCTLLYEVPRNIKWFCDKCIWDTEKWISDYSVNDSRHSRTDTIENANLDVKDIIDQKKDAKPKKKINKQNPKCKKGKARSGSKKSKNPKTTENKGKRNVKMTPIKVEHMEDDNVSIIENDDTNYDSTLEADVDYNPYDSDSDSDNKGRKKYLGKDELKKEDSTKEMIKNFQCDQCPKTFCSERRLDEHKMSHTGEYPLICNFCGKGKARPDLLKAHIKRMHTEEKPFTCPDCDFCSRTKGKLKSHIHNCHTEKETLTCTLCDYQTKKKSALKIHIQRHTGELEIKYFMCDECGVNLRSLKSLQIHQLRHSGEKPHKCELCQKSFRCSSNLRVHMYVHTKEKNAFCPVCGKGFPTKDQLDNHLKTVHTDEKPFVCEICGNKYKTKHNLKNHKSGKRGTCHPMNSQKQKLESHQKFKSSSESNMSDSNDSHLVPLRQPNQQAPLLFYAGGNEKSVAPVYSNTHISATIHCPPQYLSVINYMDQ